jgi:hypothetical protein
MAMELKDLDFTDIHVRKAFIHNNESSLYAGKDTEGREVVVLLDKGEGMTVKWLNSKGWYEGFSYDKNGIAEEEILEKARDI